MRDSHARQLSEGYSSKTKGTLPGACYFFLVSVQSEGRDPRGGMMIFGMLMGSQECANTRTQKNPSHSCKNVHKDIGPAAYTLIQAPERKLL